jgi:hypothetical protein
MTTTFNMNGEPNILSGDPDKIFETNATASAPKWQWFVIR